MSEEKPILTRIEDGVCWISINRPSKLNSITLDMLDQLGEALDKAESDKTIRCVVITGTGDRAFSAGADISQFRSYSTNDAKKFSMKGHRTFSKIMMLSKPVVAAINGYALGGGCELASFCDFRIASEKARFGQTEINLGLIPGWGATAILPRLVGPAKAKEMIMTGTQITAEEALRIGLINKVVAPDRLIEEVKSLAVSLANGPCQAIANAKKLANANLASEANFATEAESFSGLFSTSDFKEGISAFAEKRKPSFKGC